MYCDEADCAVSAFCCEVDGEAATEVALSTMVSHGHCESIGCSYTVCYGVSFGMWIMQDFCKTDFY
jgi:hypothetical protein